MKDWMILNSGEGGMLRRYVVLALFLVVGAFLGANGLVSLVHQVTPDQSARLSAHEASREAPRLYTVTRSVLDDQIVTGSIGKVDPCKK